MSLITNRMWLLAVGSQLARYSLAQRPSVETLAPRVLIAPLLPASYPLPVEPATSRRTAATQSIAAQAVHFPRPEPLYLVNERIILGRRSMYDIKPKDIENIEVTKDLGGVSRWGEVANNGVISMTLKQGQSCPLRYH